MPYVVNKPSGSGPSESSGKSKPKGSSGKEPLSPPVVIGSIAAAVVVLALIAWFVFFRSPAPNPNIIPPEGPVASTQDSTGPATETTGGQPGNAAANQMPSQSDGPVR